MFDVLVYLYEHYWRPDACPEPNQLTRKLSAVGFEADEISEALVWLDGLSQVASCSQGLTVNALSSRVFAQHELDSLGEEAVGFLRFLEFSGVLTPDRREMVLDRVAASTEQPVSLDDLKVIVLMVFWSTGQEPDALMLDELFADESERVFH